MSWKDRAKPVKSTWKDRAKVIEPELKEENTPSMLESGARGLAQGATLGFADELGGAIGAGIDKIAGLFGESPTEVNAKLAAQGFKGDIGPTNFKEAYKQSRNEQRADDLAAQEANPWTYNLSNIAGSMIVPGANLAKGTSALKAGLVGAGTGALQGAGNTEEIASMKALEDILSGAAITGATGAIGQGIANKISGINPEKVSGQISDLAEGQAARALGAERGTIKSLGSEKIKDIGRYALDNDVLKGMPSTEKMIENVAGVKSSAGSKMGDILSQVDEAKASTFNPKVLAKRLQDELGDFYRDPINKGETNQFDNILASILNRGENDIPIQEAQALKEKIGKVANWKNNIAPTDKEKMAREAYDVVNKYLDESLDVASNLMDQENKGALSGALKAARSQYAGSKGAEKLLQNKQAREQGNKMFGFTDSIVGAGGYAASPMAAIPAVLVKKGLERYGNQAAALGLDKLGKMVKANPNMFGKFAGVLQNASQRGGNALGAAHFILQQNNPEYREQLKQLEEEQE